MTERLLLRGGAVITLDASHGDFECADVLIEDGVIRAVAARLSVDARIEDVSGKLIVPGMIDSHRHTWQSPLRGLGANWTVLDYLAAVRVKLAPLITAEEVYWANYAGALEALESGVTTLVDHAHCINSPEHAAAALEGLKRAGCRALFAYGFASNDAPGFTHEQRIEQLRSIAAAPTSGLVRIGAALTEMQVPWQQTLAEIRCARELGLPITFHSTSWPVPGKSEIERLHDESLLGPDMLLVHCTHASDDDLKRVADSGAAISCTPETELQMGMGLPALGRARRQGVRTLLGCDVVCSNNGDPFALMRLALQVERGFANARVGLPLQLELTAEEMLPMLTTDAAAAIGLGARVGAIAPGLDADLLVLSTDTFNMLGLGPDRGALVAQVHAGNVEAVLVRGRFVKRAGKLVGVDANAVQRELSAVRQRMLERSGGKGQLLSERETLMRHWNIGQAEVGAGTSG